MNFELHPNLKKKVPVCDLELSSVLLEDNAEYPWIFLVPRRPNIKRMSDLNPADQEILMREIDLAENVMLELFKPDQVNVAAIGNKTPQLHVHVIARFETDVAWPGTVWDYGVSTAYDPAIREELTQKLKAMLLS